MPIDKTALQARFEAYLQTTGDPDQARLRLLPILQRLEWRVDALREEILAEKHLTSVRFELAAVLGALAGRGAEALILCRLLDDPAFDGRLEAIYALGLTASKRALGRLEKLIHSAGPAPERGMAAHSMRYIDDDRVVAHLVFRLVDSGEHPSVRGEAAESLGSIEAVSAAPLLREALQAEPLELRFWAAYAVAVLGCTRALPTLCEISESADDVTVISTIRTLREEARWAVSAICEQPRALDLSDANDASVAALCPGRLSVGSLYVGLPEFVPQDDAWVSIVGTTSDDEEVVAVWGRSKAESAALAMRTLLNAGIFREPLHALEAGELQALLAGMAVGATVARPVDDW